MIKHSVTMFTVISSLQNTLSFITLFFEEQVSKSKNFYESNVILWHYQIWQNVIWKVHGAWMDECDSQNKDKNITIMKNKSLLFFSVQCILAKTM